MVCRVLPLQVNAGARLMAGDEALLHSAAERGTPTLRFYGWSQATLSLGYFQAQALRQSAGLGDLPMVRRSSGGGAIVHHHELTYALALPPGNLWQTKESWTCRMHHIIAAAFETFGVKARTVLCGEEKKLDPFLCFLHQTPGDLLIDGHKVVGSAQRKWRGATLQHGSILLRQSPFTPALPGIAELSGCDVSVQELAEEITKPFAAATGWELAIGAWTDLEREETAQIELEKYGTAEWNGKR